MEAVKILEGSREGLPGVRGSERSDSGGGNWRGPPRPGRLRSAVGAGRPITGEEPGSGSQPGGRRRGPEYRSSRSDNITAGEARATPPSKRAIDDGAAPRM